MASENPKQVHAGAALWFMMPSIGTWLHVTSKYCEQAPCSAVAGETASDDGPTRHAHQADEPLLQANPSTMRADAPAFIPGQAFPVQPPWDALLTGWYTLSGGACQATRPSTWAGCSSQPLPLGTPQADVAAAAAAQAQVQRHQAAPSASPKQQSQPAQRSTKKRRKQKRAAREQQDPWSSYDRHRRGAPEWGDRWTASTWHDSWSEGNWDSVRSAEDRHSPDSSATEHVEAEEASENPPVEVCAEALAEEAPPGIADTEDMAGEIVGDQLPEALAEEVRADLNEARKEEEGEECTRLPGRRWQSRQRAAQGRDAGPQEEATPPQVETKDATLQPTVVEAQKAQTPARARWSGGKRPHAADRCTGLPAAPLVWAEEFSDLRVRDLCWALDPLNSVLDEGTAQGAADVRHVGRVALGWLLPDLQRKLRDLDRDPGRLHTFLEERMQGEDSHYVGRYFEALVAFALRWLAAPDCDVLLENHKIVLKEGAEPVGEVDVIILASMGSAEPFETTCSPDRGLQHVELACKFFLATAEEPARRDSLVAAATTPWERLVGPDGDTLAWKYAKMRDIQVRWSARPPLSCELAALPNPWLWMQGRLFRHFSRLARPLGSVLAAEVPWWAERVTGSCQRGWWCYEDELEQCLSGLEDAAFRCLPLKKPYWLAPVSLQGGSSHSDHGACVPVSRLAGQVRRGEVTSRVLVAVLLEGRESTWREAHRGFIMPRSWPEARDPESAVLLGGRGGDLLPSWLQRHMR